MKVVIITDTCCIRVRKQAHVLASLGYELHLVTRRLPKGLSYFQTTMLWRDAGTLAMAAQVHGEGLFHVHNEPSWMVTVVREAVPGARIVFDVHDSNYWRGDYGFWFEEDLASHLCDAYVFVSETCKDTYPREDKPAIVVPSANPGGESRMGPYPYLGGLVSEGGHVAPSEVDNLYYWRDFTDVYSQLQGKRQVYAYSAAFRDREELRNHYNSLGVLMRHCSHEKLLDEMGSYDWSLCGNTNGAKVWGIGLPNKLYDAISAGVPIVTFGSPEIAKLIDDYGIGINCGTVEELLERWDEHHECRFNVFKHRKEFVMERFIEPLVNLYKELGG